MSKAAYNAASACCLRHPAKAVLKEMAWFANEEGGSIWPSVDTLADRTGLTRRSVQKILRRLENAGAIQAQGSRLGGRHGSTRYRIDLGWVERNTERANHVRPFGINQQNTHSKNGERHDAKRANAMTENSEPGSPEQKEHEYEKKDTFSTRTAKYQQLRTEPKSAPSYEHQRFLYEIRKGGKSKSMPSLMTADQLQARRELLRAQAESLMQSPHLGTDSQPDPTFRRRTRHFNDDSY